ncbi:aminotransferase class V-fold PLP-dependent enzyme [Catalinimonas niigatensis]|uniref:aminotransferase class V-fold PLP-dependent enzyme n=1 Tax=Catalinimonas niigatensis TaxID=1397264 RepID=UPI0026660723|nr:aminotransferase class V-fold PLP-dependent enzyme [Catalinimonas niigatensis]WPP48608.1 aminotransferase class V-fold PLP-dependent enzyme [Catalinimonas niigatensis]
MLQNISTLPCQKDKFSLDADTTYLNCAYMSPLMKTVEEAGIKGLKLKQAPHQIGHREFFEEVEELRNEYARLIHTHETSRIVVIPSVSYGMAVVARNLRLEVGNNIVVAGEQFPSNVYIWQKLVTQKRAVLKTIHAPKVTEGRGKLWNEQLLQSIDKETRLVAISHVHWSDGTRFDLKAIRQKTREVGALLVIDGTQSVGALPFDVGEIEPDALICAGYKWLMGPYSIALGYFGAYFDEGEPLEEGWISRYGSEDFKNLVNYQDQYQPGALRYEVGERSNFILVPMMLQALKELNKMGVQNIQNYCQSLSQPVIEFLQSEGFQIEDPTFRAYHLFGVRLPEKVAMDKLQQQLQHEKIVVSVRGNSIRISPNVYNEAEEMQKLLACFCAVV